MTWPRSQPAVFATTTMRSRFDTTTPPGASTVIANSVGSEIRTLAVMGITTSPLEASTLNTPPSAG